MPFQLDQKCKEHPESKEEEGAKGGGEGRQRKEHQDE